MLPCARQHDDHALMRMPVMYIRKVRMYVLERRVMVWMPVRFNAIPGEVVRVLVMCVVNVVVRVIERCVQMFVCVGFRQMQPYAQRHQARCYPERSRWCFAKKNDGHRRTDKRCG